ncbi:signal transduction histidine kinase [Lachnospiraceae bacterium JC7]|nr:signal transduction histidine kinase [Lachnospiraceae bacterium JC7]
MTNKNIYTRKICCEILFGLFFLFILCSVPAYGDEIESKTVRVGYYENEVFQEGAEEGAVKTGYAYEYYHKLSEYTGWKYEYVYGGFGELYQMLLDGDIDLLAGLAWREERASLIGYPENIMGNESYYLVKHDTDDGITADPATMKGCRIGVLDSAMVSVLEKYLSDHHVEAEVVTYSDHTMLFSAFDSHEVDILAAESDGAHGREHAEVLTAFGSSEYYLCVNIDRPDLLSELNSAQMMLAAEEPNFLNSLSAKYYSISVTARAFSQAEHEWMNNHTSLRVGYLENYLPYSDTDASGNVTGVIKDMVPSILGALGIPDISVSFTGYKSYDELIKDISSGAIDVAFPVGGGLYYSEENGIYQSNAVASSPTAIIYKGEFGETTTDKFAINENNRMQYYYVKTNYPDAAIVFYPSIDESLAAVISGEVGCTTLNGLRVNDILKNRKYENLSIRQSSYNDDRCFGVKIGNEGLLKLLNRGINILGNDYAQNISYRYTEGLSSYDIVDVLRDNMAIFVSIALFVAAVMIIFLVRDKNRSKREIQNKETARKELERANAVLAETQRTKQQELEDRIALQEELLEQQKRREQQDRMITALASDYRCVYHVDLDKNDAVCYRADPTDHEQTPEGIHFPYYERFSWYAEHSVAESYREGFLKFIDPGHVREALAKDLIIVYRYLAQRDGREYYEMIRMAGVRHVENRDDHIVHAVGLGLTVIDTEMRESMAKNQALGEALAAAEEANKAKTAFLSSMSHEIRTPMNAIIGLDSLALRNESLPEETREYLEKIGGSARHLLGLINDILDMSRIEAGRLILRKEEFSFSDMLEQINTMVMSQCSEKGLHYECKVVGGVSDCYIGDDMKLKQVLINILSNAIKFTEAPGDVTLIVERTAVFRDHTTMKFRVKDTGIGMDKAFIPKVFDAFAQEDSERSNKYGSTGLGMAITKNIVELMNGTISVESEKGVGTEFVVVITLTNCQHHGSSANHVEPKKCADLKGRHILMAEDVVINAEIMKQIIISREAEIDHAENGKILLSMFEKSPVGYYDAILMDVRMPEMDGLEATEAIRALDRPDAKLIPIIALTANAFDEDVQRSLQVGMNAHLSKPVEPEHLYQTLEELIWETDMKDFYKK